MISCLRLSRFRGLSGFLDDRSNAHSARLDAALLVKKLDDLRTDDALVDSKITGELLGQLGCAVESDIHVVTFGLVVDSVGQTTLAPLLNLDNLAAVGSDDTIELLDKVLAGSLLDVGINDVDQFVLIHDPFTSFWTLALPCLRQNKDVPVTYITTVFAKKQAFLQIFLVFCARRAVKSLDAGNNPRYNHSDREDPRLSGARNEFEGKAMFVDQVKITAKAGDGGNGAVSFHREKFVQNGGPDGGDGGSGGDIVLLADVNMHTLMDFRYKRKYTAENGGNGAAALCRGRNGQELIIKVPVGTIVRDMKDGRLVADMHEPGRRFVLLKGGRGGWGNAHFATPTRQAPNFAKPGQKCDIVEFEMELKSIADVGLVGYPNVGKSTILSVVTSAKPKIANYHFTTLAPNLGICRKYGMDFVMADIPGIVEGASDGVGLGIRFLRHVERTRLLVHVVDIAGSEGRDPVEDFEQICDELVAYGSLAERPQIVAANKMDLPGAQENLERLKKHLHGTDIEVYPVSAATHQGFEELMGAIVRLLPALPDMSAFEEEPESVQTAEAPFTISRDGGVYVVEGSFMDRLIGSVNFSDQESLNYFHRTLRSSGVIDALRKAGAKEGDTVAICDMEFDFVE